MILLLVYQLLYPPSPLFFLFILFGYIHRINDGHTLMYCVIIKAKTQHVAGLTGCGIHCMLHHITTISRQAYGLAAHHLLPPRLHMHSA